MNMLKLVTFDATNTLLRFKKPPWHYYAIVASQHGLKCSENELKSRLGDSLKAMSQKHPNFGKSTMPWENWWRKVVDLTFKDFVQTDTDTENIANQLINDYRTAKCWTVANEGENFLKLLKRKGISLGIISNFDPRLKDILKDVNLMQYFDFIITSYEVGYSKPDKNIFNTALKISGKSIKPSEALHVGDDLKKDYDGAKAAGWHAVVVNANLNSKTIPPSNHMFTDLKELCIVVENNQLKL